MMRRSLAACLVTAALGCGGQAAAPRAANPPAPTPAVPTSPTAAAACIVDDVRAFDPAATFADCTAGDAALADCRRRCERDDLEACFGLGHVLVHDPATEAESNELFRRVCLAGSASACTNYAAHFVTHPDDTVDDACILRTFERTCEAADPWGCGMQGLGMLRAAGDADDKARARALLERSCVAQRGFPCMVLVQAMDRGDLAPVSAERRQALIDEACGFSPELCSQ
jgi:hypothetical protein